MPANLTPQYQKAENEYRKAQSAEERINGLQQMLQLIPKHKGTEKLQADLKTRLKEARAELRSEKKAGRKGPSYKFPHQGAGQVVIIGAPNAGKSRTVADLTKAEPQVAPYPFTTREPMPGMMPWKDVAVQLIDTPPITASHFEPYHSSLVRAADAILLCFDGSSDDSPEETAEVIAQLESRKTLLANETGFDEEDFSVLRVRTLLVVTRGDDPECNDRLEFFREMFSERSERSERSAHFQTQRVEFDRDISREELRNRIYQFLDVIRVYTKRPGKPADYQDPFTIPVDGTIEDLALKVHREMAGKLKFAKVWGTSAHDGQSCGRSHRLCDKDLVELHW